MQTTRATDLYLGFACNNRCIFCAQGRLRDRADRPRGDAIRAEIDRIRGRGVEAVFCRGGEPTLLDELPELLLHARDSGIESVSLQTNGRRLAYSMYTRALAEAGLKALDISLHGPRAAIHDYHTGVEGSWRQTLRGIKTVGSLGLRVGVTTVVTRSNFRHLREQVRLMAKLRVQALHLALARPRGRAAELFEQVVPRLQTTAPRLREAAEAARQQGLPLLVSGMPPCLLSGLAVDVLELRSPEGPVGELVFDGRCGECALRSRCPGIDQAYAERFGFDELEPVSAEHPDSFAWPSQKPSEAAALFAGIGVAETIALFTGRFDQS